MLHVQHSIFGNHECCTAVKDVKINLAVQSEQDDHEEEEDGPHGSDRKKGQGFRVSDKRQAGT